MNVNNIIIPTDFSGDTYLSADFASATEASEVTGAWKIITMYDIEEITDTERLGFVIKQDELVAGVQSLASLGISTYNNVLSLDLELVTKSGMVSSKSITDQEEMKKFGVVVDNDSKSIVLILALLPVVYQHSNGPNLITKIGIKCDTDIADGQYIDFSRKPNSSFMKLYDIEEYSTTESIFNSLETNDSPSWEAAHLVSDARRLGDMAPSVCTDLAATLKRMITEFSKDADIKADLSPAMTRLQTKLDALGVEMPTLSEATLAADLKIVSEKIFGLLDGIDIGVAFDNASDSMKTLETERINQINALSALLEV